jgi:hypothetical protein
MLFGCASRTTPPPLYSDAAGSRMNQVVAVMDGRPITLGEVVQTSIDTDYAAMLRRHFLKLVIDKEMASLGIQNSADELYRFAQAKVSEFKIRNPVEFKRALDASKKDEESYTRAYAASPSLGARLSNEKAVVYALLTRDAAQINIGTIRKGLWVFPGMLEKEFGADVEREIFAGRSVRDITVTQVSRGTPRPYSEISGDVMARVLAEPLTDATVEAYFDWLLSRSDIRTRSLERQK